MRSGRGLLLGDRETVGDSSAAMGHNLLNEIAICVVGAWVLAVLFNAGRQPVLLAYLVAGFVLGPHGLGWVSNEESIKLISDIGLMLLLFMIGLEIDLKKMLGAGRLITLTGVVQIVGSAGLVMLFTIMMGPGRPGLETVYLGVALALSSTVIIVKLLHDRRELETTAGQLTLGILVLQDLFAIIFLAIQPNLRDPGVMVVAGSLGRVGLLIGVAFVASRYVLPPLFKSVARLPELVLVGALAWCFGLSGLASALGLSRELGALTAGVALSTFPYTLDVTAKVTGIRDFFVTLFFVTLGMTFPRPGIADVVWAGTLAALLVVTRFATVFVPLYLGRKGLRFSLLPTLNLSQISELSMVLLALGQKAGDVSNDLMARAGFAFAVTAVVSAYGIMRSEEILGVVIPWLKRLGLRDLDEVPPATSSEGSAPRIFLLGFSWTASSLFEQLRRECPAVAANVRIVDFNPLVYAKLRHQGASVAYGDITQAEVLHHAGVGDAAIIVCSLPNTILRGADSLTLVRRIRQINPTAQLIITSEKLADIPGFYHAGANYVTVPRLLEAGEIRRALDAADKKLLHELRAAQDVILRDRDEIVP